MTITFEFLHSYRYLKYAKATLKHTIDFRHIIRTHGLHVTVKHSCIVVLVANYSNLNFMLTFIPCHFASRLFDRLRDSSICPRSTCCTKRTALRPQTDRSVTGGTRPLVTWHNGIRRQWQWQVHCVFGIVNHRHYLPAPSHTSGWSFAVCLHRPGHVLQRHHWCIVYQTSNAVGSCRRSVRR